MQVNVPIDVADAIQQALNAAGVNACARPLPRDLESALPITLVESLAGGARTDVVLDRFAVRLYTWAETPAEAVAESSAALAALVACQGGELGGQPCYRVTPTTMPYEAHDALHPDVPRACFTAHLYVRANTIDQ